MTFDAASRRPLLYDGADLWDYDGTTWTKKSPPLVPPRNADAQLVHDPARGVTLLFGGRSMETWEWNGTTWRLAGSAAPFGVRGGLTAFFDPVRRRVLAGGGRRSALMLRDLHEWNGTGWSALVADWPRATNVSLGVHDPERDELLLIGTMDEWSQATLRFSRYRRGSWQDLGLVDPNLVCPFGITFDSQRDLVVMLACRAGLPTTFEWDGQRWLAGAPFVSAPTGRYAGLSFDSRRARTVLFGGLGPPCDPTDTHAEYDGKHWSLPQASPRPAPRVGHAQVYDPVRGQTLVFGGTSAVGELRDDLWGWDGTNWRELGGSGLRPPGRAYASAWFDVARGRMVVLGGIGQDGRSIDDAWEWDGSAWSRIALTAGGNLHQLVATIPDATRGLVYRISNGWSDKGITLLQTPVGALGAGHPTRSLPLGALTLPRAGGTLSLAFPNELRLGALGVSLGGGLTQPLTVIDPRLCEAGMLWLDLARTQWTGVTDPTGHVAIPIPPWPELQGYAFGVQALAARRGGCTALTESLVLRVLDG
jgi:hypothetical protein